MATTPANTKVDYVGILEDELKKRGGEKYIPFGRSVMGQESNYGQNPNAFKENSSGANGPMQVTRSTFDSMKKKGMIPSDYDFNNPEHTTRAGAVLIVDSARRYGGDVAKMAGDYYGGPTGATNRNVRDPLNPNAPTTGQYADQITARMGGDTGQPTRRAALPSAPASGNPYDETGADTGPGAFQRDFPEEDPAYFSPFNTPDPGRTQSMGATLGGAARKAIGSQTESSVDPYAQFGEYMKGLQLPNFGKKQSGEVSWADQGKSILGGVADVGSMLTGAVEYGARQAADMDTNTVSGELVQSAARAALPYATKTRQWMEEKGQQATAWMSPEAQARAQREMLTLDPNKTIWQGGVGEVLSSITLKATRSLPSTLATLLPAGLMTRVGMSAKAISYLGASEAVMSTGGIANNVADEIEKADEQELMQSQRYQELRKQMGETEARQALIAEAQGAAPAIGGAIVGLISAALGKYLTPAFEKGAGLLSRARTGFLEEAPQEGLQGGAEQIAQNYAAQVYDNDRKLTEGVGESVVQEGLVGGLTGGATTAVMGGGHAQAIPTSGNINRAAVDPEDELALNAATGQAPSSGQTPAQPAQPAAPTDPIEAMSQELRTAEADLAAYDGMDKEIARLKKQREVAQARSDQAAATHRVTLPVLSPDERTAAIEAEQQRLEKHQPGIDALDQKIARYETLLQNRAAQEQRVNELRSKLSAAYFQQSQQNQQPGTGFTLPEQQQQQEQTGLPGEQMGLPLTTRERGVGRVAIQSPTAVPEAKPQAEMLQQELASAEAELQSLQGKRGKGASTRRDALTARIEELNTQLEQDRQLQATQAIPSAPTPDENQMDLFGATPSAEPRGASTPITLQTQRSNETKATPTGQWSVDYVDPKVAKERGGTGKLTKTFNSEQEAQQFYNTLPNALRSPPQQVFSYEQVPVETSRFVPGQQDRPSAEPISDLLAQLRDMYREGSQRLGVYLSYDNIESLRQIGALDQFRTPALEAGAVPLINFDGKGGTVYAKDQETADLLNEIVQTEYKLRPDAKNEDDMQALLGMITGAGTGKPPGANLVVQLRDEQGNVIREQAVADESEAQEVSNKFDPTGKNVDVYSLESVIARRQALTEQMRRRMNEPKRQRQARREAEQTQEQVGVTVKQNAPKAVAERLQRQIQRRSPQSLEQASRIAARVAEAAGRLERRRARKVGGFTSPSDIDFGSKALNDRYKKLYDKYVELKTAELLAGGEVTVQMERNSNTAEKLLRAFTKVNKGRTLSATAAAIGQKLSAEETRKVTREKQRKATERPLAPDVQERVNQLKRMLVAARALQNSARVYDQKRAAGQRVIELERAISLLADNPDPSMLSAEEQDALNAAVAEADLGITNDTPIEVMSREQIDALNADETDLQFYKAVDYLLGSRISRTSGGQEVAVPELGIQGESLTGFGTDRWINNEVQKLESFIRDYKTTSERKKLILRVHARILRAQQGRVGRRRLRKNAKQIAGAAKGAGKSFDAAKMLDPTLGTKEQEENKSDRLKRTARSNKAVASLNDTASKLEAMVESITPGDEARNGNTLPKPSHLSFNTGSTTANRQALAAYSKQQEKISSLDDDIKETRKSIADIRNKIQSHENRIAELRQRFLTDDVQSKISALQEAIKHYESAIGSLEKQVTKFTSKRSDAVLRMRAILNTYEYNDSRGEVGGKISEARRTQAFARAYLQHMAALARASATARPVSDSALSEVDRFLTTVAGLVDGKSPIEIVEVASARAKQTILRATKKVDEEQLDRLVNASIQSYIVDQVWGENKVYIDNVAPIIVKLNNAFTTSNKGEYSARADLKTRIEKLQDQLKSAEKTQRQNRTSETAEGRAVIKTLQDKIKDTKRRLAALPREKMKFNALPTELEMQRLRTAMLQLDRQFGYGKQRSLKRRPYEMLWQLLQQLGVTFNEEGKVILTRDRETKEFSFTFNSDFLQRMYMRKVREFSAVRDMELTGGEGATRQGQTTEQVNRRFAEQKRDRAAGEQNLHERSTYAPWAVARAIEHEAIYQELDDLFSVVVSKSNTPEDISKAEERMLVLLGRLGMVTSNKSNGMTYLTMTSNRSKIEVAQSDVLDELNRVDRQLMMDSLIREHRASGAKNMIMDREQMLATRRKVRENEAKFTADLAARANGVMTSKDLLTESDKLKIRAENIQLNKAIASSMAARKMESMGQKVMPMPKERRAKLEAKLERLRKQDEESRAEMMTKPTFKARKRTFQLRTLAEKMGRSKRPISAKAARQHVIDTYASIADYVTSSDKSFVMQELGDSSSNLATYLRSRANETQRALGARLISSEDLLRFIETGDLTIRGMPWTAPEGGTGRKKKVSEGQKQVVLDTITKASRTVTSEQVPFGKAVTKARMTLKLGALPTTSKRGLNLVLDPTERKVADSTGSKVHVALQDNGEMTLGDVLSLIKKNLPANSPLAKLADTIASLNLSVKVRLESGMDTAGNFNQKLITINRDMLLQAQKEGNDGGLMSHIFFHESVHAATVGAIRNNPSLRRTLETLLRTAKRAAQKQGKAGMYGLQSVDEFVAEIFANPEFQAFAQNTQTEDGSVWQRFTSFLRRLFGMTEKSSESIFDAVLSIQDQLFTGEDPTIADSVSLDLQLRQPVTDAINNIRQNIPSIDAVKNRYKDSTGTGKLALMTLEQIRSFYSKHFSTDSGNPLIKYWDAYSRRNADNSQAMERADRVSREWSALVEKHGAQELAKLSEVMSDATMYGVHPDVPVNHPSNAHLTSAAQQRRHQELAVRYRDLKPEVRQFYTKAREFYQRNIKEELNLILANALRSNLTQGRDAAMTVQQFERQYSESALAAMDLSTEEKFRSHFAEDMVSDEDMKSILRLTRIPVMQKGPYFPLTRFGDYVVRAKRVKETKTFATDKQVKEYRKRVTQEDPTLVTKLSENDPLTVIVTEEEVRMSETRTEAEQNRKEMVDIYGESAVDPIGLRKDLFATESSISGEGGLGTILKRLDGNPAAQQAIKHFYLRTLSDGAFRKHELNRKNRRGVDKENQHRAFATYAKGAAYYNAQLRHGWKMAKAKRDMDEVAYNHRDESEISAVRMQQIVREIKLRDQMTVDPSEVSKVVQKGTALSHFMLLTSPSYWMINATQPYMVTLPWLGARLPGGTAEAAALLGKAQKAIASPLVTESANSWGGLRGLFNKSYSDKAFTVVERVEELLTQRAADGDARSGEYLKMLRELKAQSIIDLSFVSELREIADNIDKSKFQTVVDASRVMAHLTEVNNRLVTAIAAYEAARSKGASEQDATAFAREAVSLTQFNYSTGNKPRLFQEKGPLKWAGPLMFQFMQYPQHMYALMIGEFKRLTDENIISRQQARKTLIGLFTTHAIAGGLIGATLQPIKWAIGAVLAGFDDDDDRFQDVLSGATYDRAVRSAATDLFGKDFGRVIAKGAPAAVGMDLSSRLSLGSLYFMDIKPDNADSLVGSMVMTFGGPVPGLVTGGFDGMKMIMEGRVQEGLEKWMPKAGKDVSKMLRMQDEGLRANNGDTILRSNRISGGDLFLQSIGIQPADVSDAYERRSIIETKQSMARDEVNSLTRQYLDGDAADRRGLIAKIAEHNRKYPANPITFSTIIKAAQRRNERNASIGVFGAPVSGKAVMYAEEGEDYAPE